MLARNLDYAPSPDELPMVASVMLDDLKRKGLDDTDAWRVEQAFSFLGPKIQKWPTSYMVINALPPRNSAPKYIALPRPEGWREKGARAIEQIRKSIANSG